MKSFFKMFLACLAAIFTSVILLYVIAVVFVVAMMFSVIGNQPARTGIRPGSVLTISLTENISDKPMGYTIESMNGFSMDIRRSLSLYEILYAIDYAKRDNNIAGIYLNIPPDVSLGPATSEEIRNALADFSDYGKFVVSYSSSYSQGSYYISSVADQMYLYPEGDITWKGMASQTLFFKGTLDKLGVEPEIIRHGKYKSAVEPFTMKGLSPESEYQMSQLVGDIWGTVSSAVAQSREIDPALLDHYASTLSIYDAHSALEAGFVDSLVYHDQMTEILADCSGHSTPRYVSLADYVSHIAPGMNAGHKNTVAVVYLEGNIVDRGKEPGTVAPAEIAKALKHCRDNDNIKSVVLRINSPGGSALAADIIWREVEITRRQKPVVVSMGDYAASGGYYVAAPADVIVSNATTVTGSIGVFGMLFNAAPGLEEKLGITVDGVSTHASSDMPSVFRAMTPHEKERFQSSVDNIYNTFVSHVAQGRNLSVGQVDSVAQGRVWSGNQAMLETGLVDATGGLMYAIESAADKAGISSDYGVVEQTETHSRFTAILQRALEATRAKTPFGPQLDYYGREFSQYARMLKNPAVYAVTPVMIFL